MPYRSARPCSYPNCPELVRGSVRFCSAHSRANDQERGTAVERGYGAAWRKIRDGYLAAHPYCIDPFGVHNQSNEEIRATDVDHIQARNAGGGDDWSNLQALCHACHSRKTATIDSKFASGRDGQISAANPYIPRGRHTHAPTKLNRGVEDEG